MTPTLPEAQSPEVAAEQLVELLSGDVQRVISEKVDGEVDFEKTWQYMRLRKTDLYYRGLQFSAPNLQGGYLDYSPLGSPSYPSGDQLSQRGMFDYNMDIVQTYGRRYFSVLGLRPFWNAKGIPSDPSSELDRRASDQAEIVAKWLDDIWKIRLRNIELFFWQWKAGTVYAYTPFVADKRLFGELQEDQYVQRTVQLDGGGYRCPDCGQRTPEPKQDTVSVEGTPPQQTCPHCDSPLSAIHYEEPTTLEVPEFQSTVKYAASGPALQLCTGYTVTIPFDCKDLNRSPYLLYEYEEDQGVLLQVFGQSLRSKMDDKGNLASDSTTAKAQGFLSRQQEFSLTAMPRINGQSRWTYSRYWLQTSMYEHVKDETKRAILYEKFPTGLKIHLVGGKIIKLEDENLADVWTAIVPEPGDAIYHDPQAWGILGQQDLKNDWVNIGVAYGERGLPTHIVDPDVVDTDAINGQSFMPNEMIAAKPGVGARLDTAVKTLNHTAFPADMMAFIPQIVEPQVQNYTGLLPPVFGGGERQPTAEGQRTILNQALMQLGVPGEYAGWGWAEVREKAIHQIAKHAPKSFAVPVPTKAGAPAASQMVDLDALRAGKWHLIPEPGVPMSWAEKRDQMSAIIKENPQLASAMGLDKPYNIPVVRDYLLTGMHEIRVPEEDLRNKVMLSIIPQLLQGEPIMGPEGPQPSVMPEEFADDPAACAELAKEWLNSAQGLKEQATNLMGYKNVLAWGMAQSAKVPPPAPEIKPSASASIKTEMYPPEIQAQILGKTLGIQVDPQQLLPPPMPGAPPPAPGPAGPSPTGESGPPEPQGPGGPAVPQAESPDLVESNSPMSA